MVEVVGFDAGDRGHLGAQLLKGAVALVGLQHQPLAAAQAALVPISLTSAPIRNEGCRPASTSTSASIDEVVVLPWVPATAMARRVAAMADSTVARRSTGMPRRRGLGQLGVALGHRRRERHRVDVADVLGPVPHRDRHPLGGQALGDRRALRSDPVTRWPMAASTEAMALIPAPPTPTTWIRRGSSSSSAGAPAPWSVDRSPGPARRDHAQRAWDTTSSATRAAASGWPGPVPPRPSPPARPIGEQLPHHCANSGPSHRGSGSSNAAPGRPAPAALAVWWSEGAPGRGTSTERDAGDRQFGHRHGTGPAHEQVGRRVEEVHPALEGHPPVGQGPGGPVARPPPSSRGPVTW